MRVPLLAALALVLARAVKETAPMRLLRGRWPVMLCAVVALGLTTLGAVWLVQVNSDVRSTWVSADGVPLLETLPPTGAPVSGGVVVAHGFAGSARLMRGFADTLARRGYVVVAPDLSGHGANTRPLPD